MERPRTKQGKHDPTALPIRVTTRARETTVAVTAALALLTACGRQAQPSENTDGARPPSARASNATQEALCADMRTLTDRPAVPLQTPTGLKPVAGFTAADVAALADRAIDVLKRSAAPKLTRMNPDNALNNVYANQYSATTFDFKQNAIELTHGYDWQWLATSRYPKPVRPAHPRCSK